MVLMDESVWRGKFSRFGGAANLEAFTGTRWVTVRGDIAPYPS
jgi:benzaldehyde dehydrogenase (NAD)